MQNSINLTENWIFLILCFGDCVLNIITWWLTIGCVWWDFVILDSESDFFSYVFWLGRMFCFVVIHRPRRLHFIECAGKEREGGREMSLLWFPFQCIHNMHQICKVFCFRFGCCNDYQLYNCRRSLMLTVALRNFWLVCVYAHWILDCFCCRVMKHSFTHKALTLFQPFLLERLQ